VKISKIEMLRLRMLEMMNNVWLKKDIFVAEKKGGRVS